MYSLTSTNMSNLGGPMGSEYTTTNWVEHFKSLEAAKKYAEKDYNSDIQHGLIKWTKGKNKFTSGDLLFVMYDIELIKTKD